MINRPSDFSISYASLLSLLLLNALKSSLAREIFRRVNRSTSYLGSTAPSATHAIGLTRIYYQVTGTK